MKLNELGITNGDQINLHEVAMKEKRTSVQEGWKHTVVKWAEDGKLDSNIKKSEDQEEYQNYIEQERKEVV